MKNIIKLQNYYLPWELARGISLFVNHFSHERDHESLHNMTPAGLYDGRHQHIQELRDIMKEQALEQRRRNNLGLMPRRDHDIRPQTLRKSVS